MSEHSTFKGYFLYKYKNHGVKNTCTTIMYDILNTPEVLPVLLGISEELDRAIETTLKKGPPHNADIRISKN